MREKYQYTGPDFQGVVEWKNLDTAALAKTFGIEIAPAAPAAKKDGGGEAGNPAAAPEKEAAAPPAGDAAPPTGGDTPPAPKKDGDFWETL